MREDQTRGSENEPQDPKKPEPGVVLRAALKCISADNLRGPIPAKQVYELVDAVTNQLLEKHRKLEQRVAQLEARPEIKYCDTYKPGLRYQEGSLVTDRGGLWLCLLPTTGRPGENSDWRLIVKRGEAGR